jgi:hypothetical protein
MKRTYNELLPIFIQLIIFFMNLQAFRSRKTRMKTPIFNLRMPHRFLFYFMLVSTLIASPYTAAQNEGRSYQVEILIFKRNPATVNSDEIWRKDINMSYPNNTQYIQHVVSKKNHQLGGHNYTLARDEDFTVLFHKAWQQQMWGEARSPSLIIRGGQSFGNHKELEGTIKIHIGRYLHVTTDLWLSEFQYTDTTQSAIENYSEWPQLPALPNTKNTEQYQYLFDNGPKPSRIITLREKRRMRSKETHYIDHPYLGILVRMLPINSVSAQ